MVTITLTDQPQQHDIMLFKRMKSDTTIRNYFRIGLIDSTDLTIKFYLDALITEFFLCVFM